MPECTADATWHGTLTDGDGHVALESDVWNGPYNTPEVAQATDPEELLAAAQASCFAMTAAHVLADAGYSPEFVTAEARVELRIGDDGFWIEAIELDACGNVPDATAEEFAAVVERAEAQCPVASALAGTEITVDTTLTT